MTARIVLSPPAGTFSESSCRREQQGDRQLGRGVGEHAGRVADDNTSPRALRQVDVVRPHRVGAHRPQTAACRPTETGDQQAGEMGTRASQKYFFWGGGGGWEVRVRTQVGGQNGITNMEAGVLSQQWLLLQRGVVQVRCFFNKSVHLHSKSGDREIFIIKKNREISRQIGRLGSSARVRVIVVPAASMSSASTLSCTLHSKPSTPAMLRMRTSRGTTTVGESHVVTSHRDSNSWSALGEMSRVR